MYTEPMKQLQQADGMAAFENAGLKSGILFGLSAESESARSGAQIILRSMANQMLSVQESERKRIASDLHDGVGQSLTLIKLALTEVAIQLASGAIGEASRSLQRLKIQVHGAMDEVRNAAMDLRPPMLDDLGVLATLSWLFRELEESCPGMKVEKNFSISESSIPEPLKITIFRITQEACSNIVKYAHADLIRVHLEHVDGVIHFSIEDNGDGFDPSEVAMRNGSNHGLGLKSMAERAHLSGGDYIIDSVKGRGTRICISWKSGNPAGS